MNDSPARLTVRLLGAPQILVAGNLLALNHLKAQALLFYLAVTEAPHTRDHLATLLWGESSTREARHSLRSSLYRLRLALRSVGADAVLIIAGDQVQFRLDEDECDVTHFRQLLETGGESALARAVALDRLASWAEARQEWGNAIGYVQRIMQVDPLAEAAQQRLMRLYLHEDAVGPAVRQYQQFKALLQQELGLAPSPETRALFDLVLRHSAGESQVAPPTRQATRKPHVLPFVGREQELTRLLAISQDAIIGHGVTVLLQGEAGIGKSRLLDQSTGQLSASSSPWMVLRGNCSPFDDLLSYEPFLEALQSVAGDDLANLVAESSRSAPDARGRFFWQVLQALRSLAASAPLVLAIDEMLHLTGAVGRLHQSLGQLETAVHWQRRNLDIAQELGDPVAQATAYFEIGESALVTNDYVAAMTAAQAGLTRIESEGNTARNKAPAPDPQTLAWVGRGHRLSRVDHADSVGEQQSGARNRVVTCPPEDRSRCGKPSYCRYQTNIRPVLTKLKLCKNQTGPGGSWNT